MNGLHSKRSKLLDNFPIFLIFRLAAAERKKKREKEKKEKRKEKKKIEEKLNWRKVRVSLSLVVTWWRAAARSPPIRRRAPG